MKHRNTKSWHKKIFPIHIGTGMEMNGNEIKFTGGSEAPGASMIWATDTNGIENWYAISGIIRYSIALSSGYLQLNGDVALPGNDYFYGTNGTGTKGWYLLSSIPAISLTAWITDIFIENVNIKLSLYNAVGPISTTTINSQDIAYKIIGKTMFVRYYLNVTFANIGISDTISVLTIPPVASPNSIKTLNILYYLDISTVGSNNYIRFVPNGGATSFNSSYVLVDGTYTIQGTIVMEIV